MLDQLFTYPAVLARYRTGPLLEERLAFLAHLTNQGYSRIILRRIAYNLLVIARTFGPDGQRRKTTTLDEVRRRTANIIIDQHPFIHSPPDGSGSWGVCKSDPLRSLPARRRSKRSLITWNMKRNCRPLPSATIAAPSRGFSINCVSKAVLCTRSLLTGSTWRFRNYSIHELIHG